MVGSAVRVGLPATSSSARRGDDLEWATHPLADDAVAWTVLGRRADEVRAVLERALGGDPSLGMPRQRARP